MNDREQATDHECKKRDRFGGTCHRLTPGGIGEAKNRGDQGACVGDADPEDEIDNVKTPEDGAVEAGNPQAVAKLHSPGCQARQNQQEAHCNREPPLTAGSRKRPEQVFADNAVGQEFGMFRHMLPGPVQIDDLRFGAQLLHQFGGAAITRKARNLAVGIVQVAKDHRLGRAGLHAGGLHFAIGNRT